jgi:hypothetical protein
MTRHVGVTAPHMSVKYATAQTAILVLHQPGRRSTDRA